MSTVDNETTTDIVVPNQAVPPVGTAASNPSGASATSDTDLPKEDQPGPEDSKARAFKILQRQRAAAERRAHGAESRAEALEARIKALEAGAAQKGADLRPSDFPNYDAFVEAKINQTVDAKTDEKLRANLGTSADREAMRAADAAYKAIMADEEAETAGVDLEAVWDTLRRQPKFPQQIFDLVAESDHPARLLEHLAENPGELDRVSRLGPAMAERALAKIQASLPKLKSKPNATDVPPPPPRVGGRGASQFDPETVSDMEQYKAYWNERRFGNKKG